jgi:PTH1 family peptidyl-tRNA hydrolase
MGIGHPAPGISVIDHVLGQFASNEADHLMPFIKSAGNAIAAILCKGTKESMNVFNRRTLS